MPHASRGVGFHHHHGDGRLKAIRNQARSLNGPTLTVIWLRQCWTVVDNHSGKTSSRLSIRISRL